MGSKVTVMVDLDRSGRLVAVSMEMPIWIVEDGFRGIDHPDPDAGVFSRMMCSDTVTIEATMKARHEIAQALTKALLDAMGAGDTRMGYPQASNAALTGAKPVGGASELKR